MAYHATLYLLVILIAHLVQPGYGLSFLPHRPFIPSGIAFRTYHATSLPNVQRIAQFDLPLGLRAADDSKRADSSMPAFGRRISFLFSILKCFNTLESSGFPSALTSGGVIDRIKSIHNPKFYLAVGGLAMLRWSSLVRNYYYWILLAFLYKWYRARYVYKVPVWDRQPNWNNVITSKEQEKDLKAYTCKNCGSTIFIAKSREFFFEGGTGIGGLGCFACGAKGADNFVMDRDRIVEDVADVDDYFEYERPLDFVTAAERKRLLREAGGDETRANEIALQREAEKSKQTSSTNSNSKVVDASTASSEATSTTAKDPSPGEEEGSGDEESNKPKSENDNDSLLSSSSSTEKKDKPSISSVGEADLDALGMDDL